MKIVIIGAGISGLSTYLFLKKHLSSLPNCDIEINIYEAYDVSKYVDKYVSPKLNTSSNPSHSHHDDFSSANKLNDEPVFTPEAIGSAIGIARNGLNVLSRLFTDDQDESAFSEILADMIREGYPTVRWQMHSARGWKLADINMVPPELLDRKVLRQGDRHEGMNLSWADSPVSLIMISRQAFWAILLRHVVRQAGINVIQHKKVVDLVIPGEKSTEKTIINFADGSSETADLVIGADGLRSIVRTAMFSTPPHQQTNTTSSSPAKTGLVKQLLSFFSSSSSEKLPDYITPQYTNLVGVGGFIPSCLLASTNYPPNTMSVAFGPNGFFGYGYVTSSPSSSSSSSTIKDQNSGPPLAVNPNPDPGPVSVFWSTFSSPEDPTPFRLDHLNDSSARSKPYEFDKVAALKAMVNRHRSWKNPSIQAIVEYLEAYTKPNSSNDHANTNANPHTHNQADLNPPSTTNPLDSLGFYPTYTTPLLPTYSISTPTSAVVLVGDAAHALHPSSGQGACQALEDAEILALLLRDHLIKSQRDKGVSSTSEEEAPNDIAGQSKADAAGQPIIALPAQPPTITYLHIPLSHFNALRIPRLTSIHTQSSRTSQMKQDMGFGAEMLMYAFIWLFTRIGGGKEKRELGGYDLVGDVRRVTGEGEGEGRGR